KQTFDLAPGTYELRFDLANSLGLNSMTVSLGGVYSEVFSLAGGQPFATVTRLITVPAATTGKLVFDHDGGDNDGLILDNVRLATVNDTSHLLGGTFTGSGIAATRVVNAATVNPGQGPGSLAVLGTYTQTAAGTLQVEIGGPTADSQYDQLQV